MKTLTVCRLGLQIAASWCLGVLAANAEPEPYAEFPYQAVITQASAEVLSGPGDQYYHTSMLAAGDAVEVHRTVGNYLGVRPPKGSYSWVRGDRVDDVGDGAAVVNQDDTASQVGSRLSNDRDVVHLRMKQGERVRVLARIMIDGVEWAQIAPPAGEFRWIHSAAIAPSAGVRDDAVLPVAHDQATVAAAADVAAPLPPPPIQSTPPQTSPTPTPQPTTPQPGLQPSRAFNALAGPVGSNQPLQLGVGTAAERIKALQLELSRRVTEPSHLWRLDDIEAQVAEVSAGVSAAEQRAALQELADRARRFAAIGRRARELSGVARGVTPTKIVTPQPLGSPPVQAPIATPPATVATATGLPATLPPAARQATYNAVGELRSVDSKRSDAPKFALVDRRGRVTSFVTPPQGVDLQPLVGKVVGVSGAQGYMPSLQTPHVQATRVALAPR